MHPASSWRCDARLYSPWSCMGSACTEISCGEQRPLHPPCSCRRRAGAAAPPVCHQHPTEELPLRAERRPRWGGGVHYKIAGKVIFICLSVLCNAWLMTIPSGSICDLHFEVLPESETSFSVTFTQPHTDSLAVCEHYHYYATFTKIKVLSEKQWPAFKAILAVHPFWLIFSQTYQTFTHPTFFKSGDLTWSYL